MNKKLYRFLINSEHIQSIDQSKLNVRERNIFNKKKFSHLLTLMSFQNFLQSTLIFCLLVWIPLTFIVKSSNKELLHTISTCK